MLFYIVQQGCAQFIVVLTENTSPYICQGLLEMISEAAELREKVGKVKWILCLDFVKGYFWKKLKIPLGWTRGHIWER